MDELSWSFLYFGAHQMRKIFLGFTFLVALSICSFICAAQPSESTHEKLPVPTLAEQAQSQTIVNEAYKTQIERAKKPDERSALAKFLIDEGLATKGDSSSQFTLFRIAMDIASKEGDFLGAMDAAEQIDRLFNTGGFSTQLAAAIKVEPNVKSSRDRAALWTIVDSLITRSIEQDRYDAALEASKFNISLSRKSADPALIRRSAARQIEVDSLSVAYADTKSAIQLLNENPADKRANGIVGQFYALAKRDWDRAIPMLAISDDADIQPLAIIELDPPSQADSQNKLADQYWELSERQKTPQHKESVMMRGAHWYRKAIPSLTGLAKAKAEARIKQVPTALQKSEIVDVLRIIDLRKHALSGDWKKSDAGFVGTASKDDIARLALPIQPVFPCTIEITTTRVSSYAHGVHLAISSKSDSSSIYVEGRDNGQPVSGIHSKKIGNGVRIEGPVFKSGKTALLRFDISKDGIQVLVDGKKLMEWKGNPSELGWKSTIDRGSTDDPEIEVSIGHQASFAITKLQLFRNGE